MSGDGADRDGAAARASRCESDPGGQPIGGVDGHKPIDGGSDGESFAKSGALRAGTAAGGGRAAAAQPPSAGDGNAGGDAATGSHADAVIDR